MALVTYTATITFDDSIRPRILAGLTSYYTKVRANGSTYVPQQSELSGLVNQDLRAMIVQHVLDGEVKLAKTDVPNITLPV